MGVNELYNQLAILNEKCQFALGLHTTLGKETCDSICEKGLYTNHREFEGTVKVHGNFSEFGPEDLDFFFPYTDHTCIVAIPGCFNTPRIRDNLGGYTCICDFSKFYKHATHYLDGYTDEKYVNVLPSMYIVGYYDKDYNLTVNPNCYLFNEENYVKLQNDIDTMKSPEIQQEIEFYNSISECLK